MKDKLGTAYKTIGEVARVLNLINPKNGKLKHIQLDFGKKNLSKLNQKYFLVGEDTMIKNLSSS